MTLDVVAKRYGVRPSSLVWGLNVWQRLTLDLAAAAAGQRAEARASKRSRRG